MKTSILQAAVRVYEGRGGEAPVQEVLEAAEISRATFYKYFASKDALREALLEYAAAKLIRVVSDAAAEGDTLLERMEAGLDGFLRIHRESPRVFQLLRGWAMLPGTRLHTIRRAMQARGAREMAAFFERHGQPPTDPIVYELLLGALETASMQLLQGGEPPAPEKIARTKAALLRLATATLGIGEPRPPLPAPPPPPYSRGDG